MKKWIEFAASKSGLLILSIRSSFWFIPTLIVLGCMAAAEGLLHLDAQLVNRWHWTRALLFDAGPDAARSILTVIASSVMNVAGVVFSITILTLSIASNQFTPRILRNFIRDRVNQVVLGIFIGIFGYCLMAIRAIRSQDSGSFIPPLSVFAGILLAVLGLGVFIFFIHHIATSIQVFKVLHRLAAENHGLSRRLFTHELDRDEDEMPDDRLEDGLASRDWFPINAACSGYLQSINTQRVLCWARDHNTIIRMERAIGDFIYEGLPVASISDVEPDESARQEINYLFAVGQAPDLEQNPQFGIRLIVDVAVKALSPGVNNTTVALECIDHLTDLLAHLAGKQLQFRYHTLEDELRLIALSPGFETLLQNAYDEIRRNAPGNVSVLTRLLAGLSILESVTQSPRRRSHLLGSVLALEQTVLHYVTLPIDQEPLLEFIARLRRKLETNRPAA